MNDKLLVKDTIKEENDVEISDKNSLNHLNNNHEEVKDNHLSNDNILQDIDKEKKKHRPIPLKITGKMTTITDVILILLSFCLYILTVCIDRLSINVLYNLKFSIFPGLASTAIKEIDFNRNYCPENFNNLASLNFPGVTFNQAHSSYNINAQKAYIYDNFHICYERYDAQEFTSKAKFIVNGENCPSDMRQCGILSQAYQNILCFKSSESCPINKVRIVRENKELDYIHNKYFKDADDLVYEDKDKEFSIYSLGRSYLIVYRNETTSEIPFDFKLAIDYPCVEEERFNWKFSKNIPPHIEKHELSTCKSPNKHYDNEGFDKSVRIIDTYNFKNFLDENDLYRKLKEINEIEKYDYDFNLDFNLYFRPFADRNYKCGKEHNPSIDYTDYLEKIDKRKINNFIRMAVFLLNMVFLIFSVSFASLVKLSLKGFHRVFLLFKTAIQLFLAGFLMYYGFKIKEHNNYLEQEILIKTVSESPECIEPIILERWRVYNMDYKLNNLSTATMSIFYLSFPYLVVVIAQSIRVGIKFYYYVKELKEKCKATQPLIKEKLTNH